MHTRSVLTSRGPCMLLSSMPSQREGYLASHRTACRMPDARNVEYPLTTRILPPYGATSCLLTPYKPWNSRTGTTPQRYPCPGAACRRSHVQRLLRDHQHTFAAVCCPRLQVDRDGLWSVCIWNCKPVPACVFPCIAFDEHMVEWLLLPLQHRSCDHERKT
jgi:hypothetical protein